MNRRDSFRRRTATPGLSSAVWPCMRSIHAVKVTSGGRTLAICRTAASRSGSNRFVRECGNESLLSVSPSTAISVFLLNHRPADEGGKQAILQRRADATGDQSSNEAMQRE